MSFLVFFFSFKGKFLLITYIPNSLEIVDVVQNIGQCYYVDASLVIVVESLTNEDHPTQIIHVVHDL